MKLKHKLTWIPLIGLITGMLYGSDKESPVQTHTISNAVWLGISFSLIICIIKEYL